MRKFNDADYFGENLLDITPEIGRANARNAEAGLREGNANDSSLDFGSLYITSPDAAALSLEAMVEQGYHTPNFTTDPAPQVELPDADISADVEQLDMGMRECCACSSCANLADASIVDSYSELEAGNPFAALMQGSAGYEIPSLDFTTEMSSNLTFTLTDTGGVGSGSNAESGFLAAAALWISFLADAVNVRLDVGFSSLSPGVLGQAGSNSAVVSYAVLRNALIADGQSVDDATAIANLQAGPALQFATHDVNGNFILDNDGSNNNLFLDVNVATLKALGITTDANGNPVDDGVSADATITFNSDFTFDFDPTDGIDVGAIDFVGVAFHEIGHALGFVSGVDTVDVFSATGPGGATDLNPFAIFSVLDLFRYSTNTNTMFPGALDLGYGGTTFFSLDGGVTNLGGFSTGTFNGDGRQASHWKDNLGLGIMDPTSAPAGTANIITELDIRALDVIGWDRVVAAADSVSLFDLGDVLVDTYETIQEAEDAASDGFRIEVDAGAYAANPESVTTDLDDLTFTLPTGVTPTITMTGTSTDLTLEGDGDASVVGNALDNTIIGNDGDNTIEGGAGADTLSGGAGNDTLSYAGDTAGVTVFLGSGNVSGGDAAGDNISGFENITGGSGNDTLYGNSQVNILTGNDGVDSFFANGGADIVYGGAGNDTLRGGIGDDMLYGGDDDDNLFGNNQQDMLFGDAGDDALTGGGGNDDLFGGDNTDTLTGNAGQDELFGGAGDDDLSGNSGGDDLFGGDGADTLNGGGGNDDLTGGADADIFVFTTGFKVDRIKDFEDGIDLIDVSGHSSWNVFQDILDDASQSGANVIIQVNPNNRMVIENFDLADLDATDFIF